MEPPIKGQIIIRNEGINGNTTVDLLSRLGQDVLSKHPDLVILMAGTNDMLNEDKRMSLELYKENYQRLITEIKKHAELILMTMPPVNSDYILFRQNPEGYKDASPQHKVDAANKVIKELAKENTCNLVDIHAVLQACGGSGTESESLFMSEANSGVADGVHPTANGYRVIGAAVYQAVSILYPAAVNIVCFGDSITFGYEMEGRGTSEGPCYPAILKRMINYSK
jgi:lysophospholipase L1-like esterase